MQTILLLVHVFAAVAMVGLILIQQGKGADAGAAFGSGASATVFGSEGSASFMTRLTAGLATIFFITSLTLAYFAGNKGEVATSVVDRLQPVEDQEIQLPVEERILEQLTEQEKTGSSGGIPVPAEK